MKFYKIHKDTLKWKEMIQIDYKWNLPILINTEYEVIVGNSLKDSLSDNIIVVIMDNNQREVLFQALFDIEQKIAEENDETRLNQIYMAIRNFFTEVRKPKFENIELFSLKEDRCITEELYIEPPPYDFNKHGKGKVLFNDGNLLLEEFLDEISSGKEPEIEIDMEILKELL